MRTIIRISKRLNARKISRVKDLLEANRQEKDIWLRYLQCPSNIGKTREFRKIRNAFVAKKYSPLTKLPASHWKNALEDACKQMDMYWQSVFFDAKRQVNGNNNLSDEQKHWCYKVLKNYTYFQSLRQFRYPVFDFLADPKAVKTAGNYLNRVISRKIKKLPRAKLSRSMMLTSITYSIKNSKSDDRKQFISVSSMIKGKPIVIPLLGYTRIRGNVRIILAGDHVEVHYAADVKPQKVGTATIRAIDIGYTEALVDDEGSKYGVGLGALLAEKSDADNKKNQHRNRLRALMIKARANGDLAKARNIAKFNLGQAKRNRRHVKIMATIENMVNRGLNKFLKEKHPDVLVAEKIEKMKAPNKGKKLNRRLAAWTRGILRKRISFKALVAGCHHEQVNPAFSSQTCPICGYVHAGNRTGGTFKCLYCGHEGHADQIAAMNLLSRYGDQEINLYVPYKSVKTILDQRFQRRVETLKKGDGSGQDSRHG